jgi:hypothetical protein
MKYTPFHEQRFRCSVSRAMKQAQTILDSTRQPRLAEDEEHKYDDKYGLAEFLTNTSIAAQLNAMERVGLDPEKIRSISEWFHSDQSKRRSVILRFQAEDTCSFIMEKEHEIESGIREIETTSTTAPHSSGCIDPGGFLLEDHFKTETVKTKIITKVKEYHWKVTVSYKIVIFPAKEIEKALELQQRSTECTIITAAGTGVARTKQSHRIKGPLPERTVHTPKDVNITWFFQMLSLKEQTCQFSIDREDVKICRTPRRNKDVDGAV